METIKQKKWEIILVIFLLCLAYFIGSKNQKEKIVYKEIVKIQKVESSRENINKNIVIKKTKTTQKDGTIIEQETQEDKTTINNEKIVVSSEEKRVEQTITNARNWGLEVGYGRDIRGSKAYSISARYRVFNSPVWIGGEVLKNNDLTGLIKIGVEF